MLQSMCVKVKRKGFMDDWAFEIGLGVVQWVEKGGKDKPA